MQLTLSKYQVLICSLPSWEKLSCKEACSLCPPHDMNNGSGDWFSMTNLQLHFDLGLGEAWLGHCLLSHEWGSGFLVMLPLERGDIPVQMSFFGFHMSIWLHVKLQGSRCLFRRAKLVSQPQRRLTTSNHTMVLAHCVAKLVNQQLSRRAFWFPFNQLPKKDKLSGGPKQ